MSAQPSTNSQPQFGKEALWRETVTLSCPWAWMGEIKMSSVPKQEKETKPVPVVGCFLASSSMFVPCSFHRPSHQPLEWAPHRWQRRRVGGDSEAPGAQLWPLTPPGLQRAEPCRAEGTRMAGRGLTLSYNTSSSWGLERTAELSGGSQYKYTAILYNSACNTCCESPSPGCQGPGLKSLGATGKV